jgi:phage antirepressor YoqD-like protein
MNEILVKGTQEFMDKEIPVVEGGFSEGQKVVLAKTIAEIHETELSEVNRKINEHIDEFELGIDLLDLKNSMENLHSLLNGIYTKQQIANSKNIYLLSEQGYMLLVGFMNTEKAKIIRKQLRREYFAMREIINSNEQLKAMALLKATEGKTVEERLNGIVTYAELKVEEETQPLLNTIEEQKPKVNWFDDFLNSEGTYNSTQVAKLFKLSSAQKLNKILNENKIIYKKGTNWLPYSDVDKSWYKLIVGSNNEHNYSQLKFSPKGVYEISKLLGIKFEKEDLKKLA